MSIYYLWHGNNEEEHLLLMTHKGVRPCNLFINGALSPDHHNSTGQVIHQCWALTQRRWMHFLVLTWMLDNSKLAQRAACGLEYSSRWPEAEVPSLLPSSSYVCVHEGREGKHNICKHGELICLPSNVAVPPHFCLWAMLHAGYSRFGSLGIKLSCTSPPCFLTFLLAARECCHAC